MARKLRFQYPGAIYHVMNRGDHSEVVFRDTHDRDLFLATLTEACAKTDWQVHSFCLMSNLGKRHAKHPLTSRKAGAETGQKPVRGIRTYTL